MPFQTSMIRLVSLEFNVTTELPGRMEPPTGLPAEHIYSHRHPNNRSFPLAHSALTCMEYPLHANRTIPYVFTQIGLNVELNRTLNNKIRE